MRSSKKILKLILFLLLIVSLLFVFNSSKNLIQFHDTTILFNLNDDETQYFTVNTDETYTLYVDDFVEDGSEQYVCDVINNAGFSFSTFECYKMSGFNHISFSIFVRTNDQGYLFNDMGHTTLIQNNRLAIGRIRLPAGDYEIEAFDLNGDYTNEIRLENSSMFGTIFKVVFGSIIFMGLLIGLITVNLVCRKKRNTMTSSNYELINQDQQTSYKFEDDDPFAKYD